MFGLINEANFFVVFIALLIIAFMLGIIFGKIFNRQGNDTQVTKDKIDKSKNKKEIQQPTNTNDQNNYNEKMMNNPPQGQDQMSRDPRYRYKNWW
jgi:preprotein translocase subunit SecG